MSDIAAVTSAPQFTQLATDDTTPSFTHSAGIPASPIASVTAGRVSIGRDADAVLEGRAGGVAGRCHRRVRLSGGQTADGGTDVPSLCGDAAACTSAQVCVSQQSCGTPDCQPVPDAGTCPAGTSATPTCPGTGKPGCVAGCPATFSCEARPAACATAVDCTCAASLCSPGTCIATMENKVACEGL